MPYATLANIVFVVHMAFIVFVALGGLLVHRHPKVALLHLPAAAWGAYVVLAQRECPLTPLENALLRRAGKEQYEGGFMEQYLVPLIYPEGFTRGMQFGLVGALVLVNLVIYVRLARRQPWSR